MSGVHTLCSIPYLFHPEAWSAKMSEPGGKTYRPWEPQHYRQESHSPEGKLPEGDLVFFLLDSVPQLDLRRFYAPYERETRGAPPFDPALMVCLLLYAYCVGVFSSRKIAMACERNLAFLAIVGSARPDFRTISDFRKLHLEAFKEVFVQVVRLAAASGLVKLGNVSTDGTKIQGNASRHKAMSYGYMKKEEERMRTGTPRRGKAPKPVEESPSDKAQSNFTDPELHIMPTPNKGWEYCGNAQASVDETCQIIVACDVTDASNDQQQAEPMAQATLLTLSQAGMEPARDDTGAAQAIVATLDNGYYSEAAVSALETLGFDPYMATGRQRHHEPETPALQEPANAKARMTAKVQTPKGKALYARRKVIVEPVFGQIKEARGFRRFLLRGLENIRGEWRLVCLTHNLLKIWRYGCVLSAA